MLPPAMQSVTAVNLLTFIILLTEFIILSIWLLQMYVPIITVAKMIDVEGGFTSE